MRTIDMVVGKKYNVFDLNIIITHTQKGVIGKILDGEQKGRELLIQHGVCRGTHNNKGCAIHGYEPCFEIKEID